MPHFSRGQLSTDRSDSPFREWFARLGEVRCLIPGTPALALTATASKKHRQNIQTPFHERVQRTGWESRQEQHKKLHICHVDSNAPLTKTFDWLLHIVGGHNTDDLCARLLIFCKSIDDCTKIYILCKRYLTKHLMKHVDMYHSQTPEVTKTRIRQDMTNPNGQVRVLICTTAAGMGVNFAGVENVINFGPPQELDTLVQQQGRAGRTGNQAHHLLIYNNRQVRNLDPEMLTYVRNENNVCRRQLLLSHYNACCDEERILHACCDICTADCKCGSPECSELNHIAHNSEGDVESDSETEPESCGTGSHVTEQQKQALNMSLEQYRMQLNEEFKAGSVTAAPGGNTWVYSKCYWFGSEEVC